MDVVGIPTVALTLNGPIALGFAVSSLLFIWIGATVRAPVKQRNEARKHITHVTHDYDDDISVAIAQLNQNQLSANDFTVTGSEVFKVLAVGFLSGMDIMFVRATLVRQYSQLSDGWNIGQADALIAQMQFIGIISGSRRRYLITDLGRGVYRRLQKQYA